MISSILFEFIIQFVLEAVGDVALHAVAENRSVRNAVIALIGYAVVGTALGYASLLLFPSLFIRREDLRTINLLFTPLLVAGVMAGIGRTRGKRHRRVVRLERFWYAYVFALAVALVRFFAAK